MKLLIVVPAFNEEESIVATLDELRFMCPDRDVLVVNDGSHDATRDLCRSHGYTLLDLPVNVGLTGGFQAGVKYALRHGYDAVLQFDADGQHVPSYIEPMVSRLLGGEGCDVVIGSRFVEGKKAHSARMIGSRLISAMIFLTTGEYVADPTSGMRLFGRRALSYFADMNDFGPEPDSLVYLMRKGLTVEEVPVQMRERRAGESYLSFSRAIEYMMRTCVSILFVQWFR